MLDVAGSIPVVPTVVSSGMSKKPLKVRLQAAYGHVKTEGHIQWPSDLPPPDLVQHEGKFYRWNRAIVEGTAVYWLSAAPKIPEVAVP